MSRGAATDKKPRQHPSAKKPFVMIDPHISISGFPRDSNPGDPFVVAVDQPQQLIGVRPPHVVPLLILEQGQY